jgi:prepilin-type N-terminal cleavage/methylation domain-containing protein/prepilin-type processing-associated H-X9-DG protein
MHNHHHLTDRTNPWPLAPRQLECRGVHGFTLVELLTVIVIISVLAALSFSGYRMVIEGAHEVTCMSNLRQLGVAALSYADDHNGSTVPAIIQNGTGSNGALDWETILVSERYMGDCSSTSSTIVAKTSVFRCPAGLSKLSTNDRGRFSNPAYASSDDAQGYRMLNYNGDDGKTKRYLPSWYGINAIVNNAPPSYPFWGLQTSTGSPPWSITEGRKIASITDPANVVGLYCGMGFHNGAIARVAARHRNRKRVNVMFMDGHVSSLPIADVQAAFLEATKPLDQRKFKGISFTTIP